MAAVVRASDGDRPIVGCDLSVNGFERHVPRHTRERQGQRSASLTKGFDTGLHARKDDTASARSRFVIAGGGQEWKCWCAGAPES